jgi:hypothetical protein
MSDTELKAMDGFMGLFKSIVVPLREAPKPEIPKEPTKALNIMSDHLSEANDGREFYGHYYRLYWKFFETDYGKQVACREDPVRTVERIWRNLETQYYPGGEFSLKLFDEECIYKNSGDNVGKLFCGDRAIDCYWDPPTKDPTGGGKIDQNRYVCKKGWTRQTVFTCPF